MSKKIETPKEFKKHPTIWFMDRVGKDVFKNDKTRVKIKDEPHAVFLYDCQFEFNSTYSD